jgi:transposase
MLAQMSLLSPAPVVDSARELRRYLVRARSTDKDLTAEEPAINQLSKTFIEAASADLARFREGDTL